MNRRRFNAAVLWCREEERELSNDGVIHYENRLIQIDLRDDMPVKAKVIVRAIEDGSVRVLHRTRTGVEHELTWRNYRKPPHRGKRVGLSDKAIAAHEARHPAASHPWRGNDYLQHKRSLSSERLV